MSDLPPIGRDGWRTVGISSAAASMVGMEITVITLAFPEIREQFSETSESALSWMFSAYNIGVALVLGLRWLPDTSPSPGTDAVDLVGVLLAGVGVGALVLGIVQGRLGVSRQWR
jgi:hypothetical protein